MNKRIVIVGASGHGKVIADIAKKNGYSDIVFLDDNALLKECNGYPVVGTSGDANQYSDRDFIVAIGNARIREAVQNRLAATGMNLVTLVHPNAVIGENVSLDEGTVVMAGAVLNPCVKVGKGCIINTCASVDHDCTLGDFAHVSVGAHVAGTVTIGERTWLGIGSVVSNNIDITSDCMIGAGAVVVKNIQESGTYVGVPAKKIIK